MKHIIRSVFLAFFVSAFSTAFAQLEYTAIYQLEKAKNGEKKHIRFFPIYLELQDSTAEPTAEVTYRFDAKGNLRSKETVDKKDRRKTQTENFRYNVQNMAIEKKISANTPDSDNEKYTYKYDAKGNLIEECSYINSDKPEKKIQFKYNAQGELTEYVKKYADDELIDKRTWKYDKQGNRTEFVRFKKDGISLSSMEETEYDSLHHIKSKQSYIDADKKPTTKTIYTTDEKGNILLSISTNAKGEVVYKVEKKYDGNGNILEAKEYFHGEETPRNWSINKYDEDNLLIETIYLAENQDVLTRKTFSYNKKKQKTEYWWHEGNGQLILKYEYRYDDHGNLVSERFYDENQQLQRIVNHLYEY